MRCQPHLQWWISPPAPEHKPFNRPPPLLLPPYFSCALSWSILFILSFASLPVAAPRSLSLFPCLVFSSLQQPSELNDSAFMTLTKGAHLFPTRFTLSVSLLLVFSLHCSACLHTSAPSPPPSVFCPFNILSRWKAESNILHFFSKLWVSGVSEQTKRYFFLCIWRILTSWKSSILCLLSASGLWVWVFWYLRMSEISQQNNPPPPKKDNLYS